MPWPTTSPPPVGARRAHWPARGGQGQRLATARCRSPPRRRRHLARVPSPWSTRASGCGPPACIGPGSSCWLRAPARRDGPVVAEGLTARSTMIERHRPRRGGAPLGHHRPGPPPGEHRHEPGRGTAGRTCSPSPGPSTPTRPELAALWTHCAVADEPGHPFTDEQRPASWESPTSSPAPAAPAPPCATPPTRRRHPPEDLRFDLVRAGIAGLQIDPPELAGAVDLRPLSLHAHVTHVKRVTAGERRVSYGLRHGSWPRRQRGYRAPRLRRRRSPAPERRRRQVLVGAAPIVGVVTMDQLMVDCGRPCGG